MADGMIPDYPLAPSFPRSREPSRRCRAEKHSAFRRMGIFCFLYSVLCPLNAEELPDPTRPPASITAPVVAPAGGAAVKQSAGLQSIIISKTRRAAIIDGESVELGGKHGDVKLIEVNEGSVVLRGTQGRQVLTLFPDVKITSREAVKANPDSPASKVRSGKQKTRPGAHKEEK